MRSTTIGWDARSGALFRADRASMLTKLMCQAISTFGLSLDELTTTRPRSRCRAPTALLSATRAKRHVCASATRRSAPTSPNTRAEVGEVRRFVAKHTPSWTGVLRRTGKRIGDPEEVFLATPAPSPSVEGYRIVWVRSNEKLRLYAGARRHAIEKARVATGELDQKLKEPRCRLRDAEAVGAAGKAAIEGAGAARWVSATVAAETLVSHEQQHRGRPGPSTA
jgi:hypothetical protein